MLIDPGSFLCNTRAFGDAVALLDRESGRVVRYAGLRDYLVGCLAGVPMEKHRPFATWERPTFEHASLLLALLAAGSVVAPLGFRLPHREAVARAEGIGAQGLARLREGIASKRALDAGAPGTILFTSGSSGSPRALWHDLSSHLHNAAGAFERIPLEPGCGWLLSLPLHHVSGFAVLIRCLAVGATVVFPESSAPLEKQVDDPAVTHLSVVALQLRGLLEARVPLERLRAVLAGGGPVDAVLVADAVRAGVPLHITYGMTEAGSQIATTERLLFAPPRIHAGTPLPGREVRISPAGEIQVRGAILAKGVIGSNGVTNLTEGDGWFSTADRGEFTPEGHLIVLGRSDRMIVSGGENIHPEALEQILIGVPGVRRVVVVGVDSPRYGRRPVAFVSGEAKERLLRARLEECVEKFAVPDVFFPWPEGVPETTGKLDFRMLEGLAAEQIRQAARH
jgi:O-succinylbenzoic acid--CoA ligase